MGKYLGLLILFFSLNAFSLQQYESDDFNQIARKIRALGQQYGNENVLVVHDLDNTLLAMTTDLGSDQWFDWQSALLKNPESPDLVAKTFDGLMRVQGILFAAGSMRLTQNDLPVIYQDLTQEGFAQILLTSRGPDYRDSTEREILNNHLPVWNANVSQTLVSEMPYDLNNLAASCLTETDKTNFKLSSPRLTSTGKNIILSSGQHKGMILKTWLCKSKRHYRAIVFSDDKQKNVDTMAAAFGASTDIELVTFRYSREDARVSDFANGDKAQAILDWRRLGDSLVKIFVLNP